MLVDRDANRVRVGMPETRPGLCAKPDVDGIIRIRRVAMRLAVDSADVFVKRGASDEFPLDTLG